MEKVKSEQILGLAENLRMQHEGKYISADSAVMTSLLAASNLHIAYALLRIAEAMENKNEKI